MPLSCLRTFYGSQLLSILSLFCLFEICHDASHVSFATPSMEPHGGHQDPVLSGSTSFPGNGPQFTAQSLCSPSQPFRNLSHFLFVNILLAIQGPVQTLLSPQNPPHELGTSNPAQAPVCHGLSQYRCICLSSDSPTDMCLLVRQLHPSG